MKNSSQPSVVITTRDRPALLKKAILSVQSQTIQCEIIVIDDGSADNQTVDLIQREFEHVLFRRNEKPLGIIQARNEAFGLASGKIIFTLDDDAVFAQNDLVQKVVSDFNQPFIGAVTIPLIDHFSNGTTSQRLPIEEQSVQDYLCTPIFSGGANALRADFFEKAGGYIGDGRQGEERSLAIRFAEIGLYTKVAQSCHIDHFPIANNAAKSVGFYNVRNSIVFGGQLIPHPFVLWHVFGTIVKHSFASIKTGEVIDTLKGVAAGLWSLFIDNNRRSPVSRSTYLCFRELVERETYPVSQLKQICLTHKANFRTNED